MQFPMPTNLKLIQVSSLPEMHVIFLVTLTRTQSGRALERATLQRQSIFASKSEQKKHDRSNKMPMKSTKWRSSVYSIHSASNAAENSKIHTAPI